MARQFFYSGQIRRFMLQFQKAFSFFRVEYGRDRDGNVSLITVPCRYGDWSRQGAAALRENSENKLISSPMISYYITDMTYDRDRLQPPHFVDKRHIRQREFDEDTGQFTTRPGNAFTLERHMPVPYTLTINCDLWTSNQEQKNQLIEQMVVYFNPSLEIQSTDNWVDWTSLTRIEIANSQWTNRSIPMGTDSPIDIATWTFTLPIWITAPAKQKKLGVIRRIITSIFDETGSLNDETIDSGLLLGERLKVSWNDYKIIVNNGVVELHDPEDITTPSNDELDPTVSAALNETATWKSWLSAFGEFQDGISQLRLYRDDGTIILGTVSFDPTNDRRLLLNVDSDTIPTNSLTAVTAVIDPTRSGPGAGLDAAALGQRYLITENIGNAGTPAGPTSWQGTGGEDLIAGANDIIEWNGTQWVVDFDSSAVSTTEYVTNANTGIQYKWDEGFWTKSWEGVYQTGDWDIVL